MFLICLLAGLRLVSLIIVSRVMSMSEDSVSRDVAGIQKSRHSKCLWPKCINDLYDPLCMTYPDCPSDSPEPDYDPDLSA